MCTNEKFLETQFLDFMTKWLTKKQRVNELRILQQDKKKQI